MDESFYVGTRFNSVSGEEPNGDEIDISRINIGGGWFMTENVMTKLEYVKQSYDGFSGDYAGAEFSGIMLEAVISF
jgi:diaminopimelate decarboxylase